MLAVPAVRESVIEAGLASLAFVRLLGIGAVAKQRLFGPVLQFLQQLAVMHFGRGKFSRMNNGLPLRLHADMAFGPEVPLVGLASRTHLRIPFLAAVFLAHWCSQQGGVHNCPRFEHQPMRV